MAAGSKRHITAEDLYRFEHITDACISPDGRFIIYAVQHTDKKTQKKISNLWRLPADGGKPRQFTVGDHVDSMPRWSPNSQEIAFLSNRADPDKPPSVYLIPVDGGEARPLTTLKGTVGDMAWSPDGKRLGLMFRKMDPDALEREKDETKKKLGVVARHIKVAHYKNDGAGYLSQEKWHIWTVNTRTGKAKQITDGPYDDLMPTWSPDSTQIAFISNRSEAPDLTPDQQDIFLVPAAGGDLTKLTTKGASKYELSFSPDGRFIAYIGDEKEGEWWQNAQLWLAAVDGNEPVRQISKPFDYHLLAFSGSDTGGGEMMPPTWSPDGSTIYVQSIRKGDVALLSFSPIGDATTVMRVIEKPGLVGPYTFDAAHKKMAYLFADQSSPPQLFVRTLANGEDRQLTQLNSRWLRRLALGQIEEVWFDAQDGYTLHGWILKPPNFDPAKLYPSILEIHGGPQTQYDRGFMHEFYTLAAAGYVVYWCNPRGGQGYGEAHCRSIWNNWGTIDYDDVMAWAHYMRKQPYIDPRRMGITGGSYGRYLTNVIIGKAPEFFQAAVTQRTVSNFISMWGSSDVNWQFQQSVADNKPPFEHFDKYWEHSPLKYIGNAQTPTLVIHSEQDMRVSLEQGEQVFIALRRLGVDTELVLYPDESHGLSRGGRMDRRIDRLNHIVRWFDKYLK